MTESGLPTSEHLEHLDTDTIADLIENLLPAPEAHRAREHVKACPDCQQTYDALLQLTEDLADEGRSRHPDPGRRRRAPGRRDRVRVRTARFHGRRALAGPDPRGAAPAPAEAARCAAAGVVLIAALGVGVVIATEDHGNEGAAGINPNTPAGRHRAALTTRTVGPQVQRWLENTSDPMLHGYDRRAVDCARTFAAGRVELERPTGPARQDRRQARHDDRAAGCDAE